MGPRSSKPASTSTAPPGPRSKCDWVYSLNAWAQVHGLATLFRNQAVPKADHPAAREAALAFVLAGLSAPSGPGDGE